MKKILTTLAALVITCAAFADSPAIRAVEIDITLLPSGAARVEECWDVHVTSGTEWYLVKDNLGDIQISDLTVRDEQGTFYMNDGEWNVDRSLREKAGRCGIVHKKNGGAEICWGVGSMGDHTYLTTYLMTNVVKSLNDYDMMHMQLVSPGLSSRPESVRVRIRKYAGAQIDTTNTRIWGFGYVGKAEMRNDAIFMESTEQFRKNSSIIILARFDKGYFNSPSVQERNFQDVLDVALEGSSFEDDRDDDDGEGVGYFFLTMLLFIGGAIGLGKLGMVANQKSVLGMKLKDVEWSRNVPFDGDVLSSEYVLRKLGVDRRSNSFAGALILRMIYNGQLTVLKSDNDKVEIAFTDKNIQSLDPVSAKLYEMMVKASGSDRILQDKEFSRWSRKHVNEVNNWVMTVSRKGKDNIIGNGYASATGSFNETGKAKACDVIGFRKFLKDFSLVNERAAREVTLWQDYLVFASLYGIADKVAAELKDIDPKLFEQTMAYDYNTINRVLYMSHNLGNSITRAQETASSGARGGFGGGASFGGGGGFSGGGFGGGSR